MKTSIKSLAFIPARGGSKRLPGKNIKLFGGFPLIYYSIAFAQYNGFTRIIVSTDDEDIATLSRSFGAEVLMRPSVLSSDTATTAAAALHCLDSQRESGFEPDVFITLQPTNPLRPKQLYDLAIAEFLTTSYDSVISVGLNKRKFGAIQNGLYTPRNYDLGERSQEMNQLYFESGLLYLTKPSVIKTGDIFGKKIKSILTPEPFSAVDIDDEFDFTLGELLLNRYRKDFLYLINR